jgi:hypothetical protein
MQSNGRPVEINMSGIPIAGVGGLGMVAVAIVMAYVLPESWMVIGLGVIGGGALAIGLLLLRRYNDSHRAGSDGTHVLFRAEGDRVVDVAADETIVDRQLQLAS